MIFLYIIVWPNYEISLRSIYLSFSYGCLFFPMNCFLSCNKKYLLISTETEQLKKSSNKYTTKYIWIKINGQTFSVNFTSPVHLLHALSEHATKSEITECSFYLLIYPKFALIPDIHLVVRYFLTGTIIWASLTLALVVLPSTVVMVLSMRWHLADKGTVPKTYWVAHICQSGIMHRWGTDMYIIYSLLLLLLVTLLLFT